VFYLTYKSTGFLKIKVKLHLAMPLDKESSKIVRKYTDTCAGSNSMTAAVGHITTGGGADATRI